MPRSRVPTLSPLETLNIGRRRIEVGDELTLRLKVQRIRPYAVATTGLWQNHRHACPMVNCTPSRLIC